VEDGSGQREEMRATHRTGVASAACDAVVLAVNLARRTERDGSRKPLVHEVIETRIIVGKLGLKLFDGVLLLRRDGLAAVHGGLSYRLEVYRMTDKERISAAVTVGVKSLEIADDLALKVYALTLIARLRGVMDVEAAIAEILAQPDLSESVKPVLQAHVDLRRDLQRLAPERLLLVGKTKRVPVN